MRQNLLLSGTLLCGCWLMPGSAAAAVLDPAFEETVFVESPSLVAATGLAWAPDDSNRLFVVRKEGEIRVVKNGVLLPAPFATVSPLHTEIEAGLVGIAFDPNFLVNRYVYVFATVSPSEQQIIRYIASGDVGASKTTILSGLPAAGNAHLGGGLGFGLDGKLYWGIGDSSGIGVDGDLASLFAKIGRASADGTAPNDNPFFDGTGPNNDYVWARGMRNPFTFSIQPATGLLWVASVGDSYEQIFSVRRGDHAGWDNYENDQPTGFISPKIKYRTNEVDTRAITSSGAVRNAGAATFSTTATHGFRAGEKLTISGVANSSFNGSFFVSSVLSSTSFRVAQAGPNAQSGGGSATTLFQGGCVTGGEFYEATQFPSAYRGNYFYGDYNSARIMRATLDPASNDVTSVDHWADGGTGQVDLAVGPDGALYYIGHGDSRILCAAYKSGAQGIVLSPTILWTAEGQSSVFSASLQRPPAANVTVSVVRSAGDSDISVVSGAALTFTPSNWNVPQKVTVNVAGDADSNDDAATITVSSGGLAAQSADVRARDQGAVSTLVLSTAALAIAEGSSGGFTVALSSAPPSSVSVTVARSSGDADISVTNGAFITFTTSNWSVPRLITVAAREDPDNVDDKATISLTTAGIPSRSVTVTATDNEDAPPAITSTAPTSAAVGALYRYDVDASGRPASTFSLDSSVTGMSINASTGLISWTPPAAGFYPVVVRARNGIAPDATQSFTIVASADAAPTSRITRPTPGEVVAGSRAEFYGDGSDDVGTVRAEFYVDGVLRYTDVNSGHYHYRGGHNLFNTTVFSNGSHIGRMTVYDTSGKSGSREVSFIVANGALPVPSLFSPTRAALVALLSLIGIGTLARARLRRGRERAEPEIR